MEEQRLAASRELAELKLLDARKKLKSGWLHTWEVAKLEGII